MCRGGDGRVLFSKGGRKGGEGKGEGEGRGGRIRCSREGNIDGVAHLQGSARACVCVCMCVMMGNVHRISVQ